MRIAIFTIGLLVGGLVLGALLVDEGEVVTVTSHESNGYAFETQLWIVETAQGAYLRANSPDAEWLARVRTDPHVELHRGEEVGHFVVVPETDPQVLSSVNAAMAAKYRTSDRLLGLLFDRGSMVPLRLEQVDGDVASDSRSRRSHGHAN